MQNAHSHIFSIDGSVTSLLISSAKAPSFVLHFGFELWPENTTFKKVLKGALLPPRAGFVSYTHVLVIGNSMKKHNIANEARVGHITALKKQSHRHMRVHTGSLFRH